MARQNPDGHLLTVSSASSHGTNPAALPDTVRYDAVNDFSHLAIIGGGPMVIVVPGSSPYRTVAELVAAAKLAPAPLLWGSSGSGGIGHLTGSLFAHRSGFRGEYVPYRGGSAVLEAMRKAEIDFSAEVMASALPHLRDGSSRPLAVTGMTRSLVATGPIRLTVGWALTMAGAPRIAAPVPGSFLRSPPEGRNPSSLGSRAEQRKTARWSVWRIPHGPL